MEINENGIFNNGESLINFSDPNSEYTKNPFNYNELNHSYISDSTNRIREVKGPMVVCGDLLVHGDIIGIRDIYCDNNNRILGTQNQEIINNLEYQLGNQRTEIDKLNKIIYFLCEKLSVNPDNLDNETEKLKDRTDIDKRLDAI